MKQTVTLPAYLLPAESTSQIATVEHWEKAIGAAVLAGEPLARLRAGDTTFLVPSPTFGVLSKKCALPGEAIEAGEPLAVLMGVSAPLTDVATQAATVPTYHVPTNANTHRLSAHEQAIAAHHARSTPTAHAITIADVSEALRFIGRARRGETVSGAAEHLSLLPFVLSAVAASLVKFPELNSRRVSDTETARENSVNIGIETWDGAGELWTPVLANAHRASVLSLSRDWTRLTEKVTTNSLTESDISGATFIVSEASGILYRTPVLHRPLVAHLNFGKSINDQIHLCLSYDVALVSDAIAEAFLADVGDGLGSARFLFA